MVPFPSLQRSYIFYLYLKVLIIKVIILIKLMKELCQLLRIFKLVNMKVRSVRCGPLVILLPGSHGDRQNVMSGKYSESY